MPEERWTSDPHPPATRLMAVGGATELDELLRHPVVARVERSLRERPGAAIENHTARRAAVALILRGSETMEALELLLIKRAAYAGDPWSGHVALPGGRHEPGDATLADTAVRETWEETAVDLRQHGRLLGALDELHPRTPALPSIVISPFVFALGGDRSLRLSPEVADAFWLPLATLRNPVTSRELVLQLTGGPRTVQAFQHGTHVIWGLTERILRSFLAVADGAPETRETT